MKPFIPSQEPLPALMHIDEVEPLSSKDDQLVKEVYKVLKKHNALQRFGLSLLHQHFDIEQDEILLESTDTQNRTQLIVPVKKDSLDEMDCIQTAWRLDSGSAVMSCVCRKDPNGNHAHYHIR